MNNSTQTAPVELRSHSERMTSLQWAAAHAAVREQGRALKARKQRQREERRERYPDFLLSLVARREGLSLSGSRGEGEMEMDGETEVDVETQNSEEVDGADEAELAASTHDSDTAPASTWSESYVGGSGAGRDLAVSVERVRATHDVLLDKKAEESKSNVEVREENEDEPKREQSWAMMGLTHNEACWVKSDRDTDLPCPCLFWKEMSTFW